MKTFAAISSLRVSSATLPENPRQDGLPTCRPRPNCPRGLDKARVTAEVEHGASSPSPCMARSRCSRRARFSQKLTLSLIEARVDKPPSLEEVTARFEELYQGTGGVEGLKDLETLIPAKGEAGDRGYGRRCHDATDEPGAELGQQAHPLPVRSHGPCWRRSRRSWKCFVGSLVEHGVA